MVRTNNNSKKQNYLYHSSRAQLSMQQGWNGQLAGLKAILHCVICGYVSKPTIASLPIPAMNGQTYFYVERWIKSHYPQCFLAYLLGRGGGEIRHVGILHLPSLIPCHLPLLDCWQVLIHMRLTADPINIGRLIHLSIMCMACLTIN